MPILSSRQNQDNKSEERPDEGVPQPPPFERQIQIAPLQLIGIPLLALLPLLALFGVFGESRATEAASNEEIAIEVDYVSRFRYKMVESMTVEVTNLSHQAPATITVAFERDYIVHFSAVTFAPTIKQIMADTYRVELTGVRSGQTQVIDVELQGEHYGRETGNISAAMSGNQPVTVSVSTTVFP